MYINPFFCGLIVGVFATAFIEITVGIICMNVGDQKGKK